MTRRRREERDLRSLERRSMYSIFQPLDPSERPPKNALSSPWSRFYRPMVDEVSWKYVLAGGAWFPALLALILLELWLQLSPLLDWLLLLAFCFLYVVAALLVLRRR